MELISVIVPVYNVSNYLNKCIESLLGQSFAGIDIVLVDDGSTDDSGLLCDKFAEKDKRIRVFHQENKGLSEARNTGINNAFGDYITFVDSDDYVSGNYIERLYDLIIDNHADISCVSGDKFYDHRSFENQKTISNDEVKIYNSYTTLKRMLYRKGVDSYAWGKLFKKELFNNIRFPANVLFEDVRTIYKLYDKAERIVFSDARLYYYRQRQGSIVNSGFSPKKIEQVTASEEILRFVKCRYPKLEDAATSKYFIAAVDVFRRIPKGKYVNEKESLKTIIRKYRKSVLKDKENKILTRVIAAVSFVSIDSLNYIGRIYQWLIEKGLLKPNPI